MTIGFVLLWLAIGASVGILVAALAGAASRGDSYYASALEAQEDDMCPNCVTPWKCNGPHEPKMGAASRGEE